MGKVNPFFVKKCWLLSHISSGKNIQTRKKEGSKGILIMCNKEKKKCSRTHRNVV